MAIRTPRGLLTHPRLETTLRTRFDNYQTSGISRLVQQVLNTPHFTKPAPQPEQKGKAMEIYTKTYNPFILGGDVHQFIKTDVPVGEPQDLGKGYSAYLVTAPNGTAYVVEATTGALLGTDLSQVLEDVVQGDPAIIENQLSKSKLDFEKARLIQPDEFWRKLKAN